MKDDYDSSESTETIIKPVHIGDAQGLDFLGSDFTGP